MTDLWAHYLVKYLCFSMRKQNAADFRLILDTIFAQPRTAHYETVIKSFEIFIHVMKQHIILEAYFSRFGPITDYRSSKCLGGLTN